MGGSAFGEVRHAIPDEPVQPGKENCIASSSSAAMKNFCAGLGIELQLCARRVSTTNRMIVRPAASTNSAKASRGGRSESSDPHATCFRSRKPDCSVMPEQGQQDDDGQGNAQQPKQCTSSETHNPLLAV